MLIVPLVFLLIIRVWFRLLSMDSCLSVTEDEQDSSKEQKGGGVGRGGEGEGEGRGRRRQKRKRRKKKGNSQDQIQDHFLTNTGLVMGERAALDHEDNGGGEYTYRWNLQTATNATDFSALELRAPFVKEVTIDVG